MPQKKWKTALIWSTVATVVIAGLELFVRMSSGTKAADALAQVAWWVVVWPAIFGAIWLITSWRELTKQSQMKAVERQARRAASSPVAPADVVCPKCGFANPSVAIRCVHCDFEFRPLEVVHVAELLPGARESLPSVLYVVAVVVSFVIGGGCGGGDWPGGPRPSPRKLDLDRGVSFWGWRELTGLFCTHSVMGNPAKQVPLRRYNRVTVMTARVFLGGWL